jgi:hypothetical protein
VPPVTVSFEDPVTSKMIHFWTEPIAKLLEVDVSRIGTIFPKFQELLLGPNEEDG